MVYCHECGEQVAENDVFCPYCGITLAAANTAGVALPEVSVGGQSKPAADAKPFETAAVPSVPAANYQNADFANDITAENLDLSAESFAVPSEIPQISEAEVSPRFGQSGNSPVGSATAAIETIKPVESISADKIVPENAKVSEKSPTGEQKAIEEINLSPVFVETEGESKPAAAPNELPNESSLTDFERSAVEEILPPAAPETSVDEIETNAPPVNFDVNAFDAKPAADYDEDVEMERAFAQSTTTPAAAEPKFEIPPVAAKPIAMPSIDLPVEEQFPPSRFDSVSIMEKPAPVAEKASEIEPAIPEKVPPIAETPAAAAKNPFTQPNLGGSDTDGSNKKKLKPLDEGTVLNGRYEIVRKIGGGGMGAVYLASDKNLGGVLRAVKEMVQSYIEEEQQDKAVNDFKRESLLLTSLDHQSIPTIYDYFFDEKEARFYLVMKYISGGDLSSRLRSAPTGRIDEAEVTKWAAQITDVLDYLHNRQPPIVYRDLKPANIMIDANSGRTMLIDFGIARWVNKEEKGVTAVGTMGYAPPELFSGNVESRSDIYSLGSTMFHLLTGADPQSNPLLIFDFQKNPRPRQINPQLSDQMERILMRAVEYSADKRFASAAELRQQLEEHLENLKKGTVTFGVKEAPAAVALSDQPVFCGFCGQKIVATDMFCAFCGAQQPLAQPGVHSESYAPLPLTAQLLIIGTNELEQPAFRLEKDENLVGRRDPQSNIFPEVDLSKYDPQTKISRRHARIWRQGGEFMVEDLGSSNGTYLLPVVSDTVRLQPRQPQLLTNGDKIRLGDTTLHFILG